MSFASKYVLSYPLNSGRFGTVYRALSLNDNRYYAVKTLLKNRQDFSPQKTMSMIRREEKNYKLLNGKPGIAELYEFLEDNVAAYFVMQLYENGDLEEFSKKTMLTEKEIATISKQVCVGIKTCNDIGIAMCDVKPSNVLIDSQLSAKLCDFGCSQECTELYTGLNSSKGTIMYMAPEVLLGSYGQLCDVHSLGIMVYYLITKTYPYEEEQDVRMLMHDVMNHRLVFKKDDMSDTAYDFVERCTMLMNKRMTIDDAMKHPFLDI